MSNLLQKKEPGTAFMNLIKSSVSADRSVRRYSLINELHELSQKDNTKKISYLVFFIKESILGLIRHQSINLDALDNKYKGRFSISASEYSQWQKTFKQSDPDTPFSFYLKSSTNSFLRIMSDLGVNLKNVLHLRNEFKKHQDGLLFKKGEYTIYVKIDKIRTTGKHNAVVTFSSTIRNTDDNILIENIDHFMIRNVSAQDQDNIKTLNAVVDTSYRKWLQHSKFKQEEVITKKEYKVDSSLGINYGFISGDLNLVHTTNIMARLFGFKRAFIQGLCTANIVLANLPNKSQLSSFAINFNKPVYTNSNIKIEYTASNFKVLDQNNTVLVHGSLAFND